MSYMNANRLWEDFEFDYLLNHQEIYEDLISAEGRGGLVCLNSAARFDKWNRTAVR